MFVENEDGDECSVTEVGGSAYRGNEYDADREVHQNEFLDSFNRISETLCERDKAVLDMMIDGMPPREMAKELGCNANAAAIRSCNIRAALKASLASLARENDIYCAKLAC